MTFIAPIVSGTTTNISTATARAAAKTFLFARPNDLHSALKNSSMCVSAVFLASRIAFASLPFITV